MKINKFLVVSLLALMICACIVSYNPFGEKPVTKIIEVATVPTQTKVVSNSVSLPVTITEKCVISEGLWLRDSSEVKENNKLLALPYGTRMTVIIYGEWSRVYLKPNDLYGYVKSQYLGECPK